ncbi:MAG: hypothetical protein ACI9N1_000161 [Flavobacteriales bacterium]
MSNTAKYGILGAVVIGLLLLFYALGGTPSASATSEANETKEAKKPVNPHGSYLLYNLLKNFDRTASIEGFQTTREKPLKEMLNIEFDINGLPSLYISIIETFDLNYSDQKHLLSFVEAGNCAFISSDKFDTDIGVNSFGSNLNTYYDVGLIDTLVEVNYVHPDFKTNKPLVLISDELNFHERPKYKKWLQFMDISTTPKGAQIATIGDNSPVAILVEYGEGFFIFHSQPHNFSNVNILREDGTINAENIFSHFPNYNAKWHKNFGKYSPSKGKPKPKRNKKKQQIQRSSPLQFVLQQPALLFALILIIIGLVTYMIIFSKRRQKIIPPIEPNNNASLEFVSVVSQLYFKQKQHNKLVYHLRTLFRSFIQDHYYVTIDFEQGENLELVSDKSGIEIEKIKDIIDTFKSAKNKTFTEADLINLYVKLDNFYNHCN